MNWVSVCSGNGLSLIWNWCQAIYWTNDGLLLTGPGGTSVKFTSKYNHFPLRKCFSKYHLQNISHFFRSQWAISFQSSDECINPNHDPLGYWFNMLRLRENGCHSTDNIFRCIFFEGNGCISINISFKFVPMGQINNIPALVHIMVWRRPGDKLLSEPLMASLLMHICITRPQRVIECLAPSQYQTANIWHP